MNFIKKFYVKQPTYKTYGKGCYLQALFFSLCWRKSKHVWLKEVLLLQKLGFCNIKIKRRRSKFIKLCVREVFFKNVFVRRLIKFTTNHRSSRPAVFSKKEVLKNFAKFTGKRLCLRPATLLKKRLRHRRFPANFAKFLRTLVLTEHLR